MGKRHFGGHRSALDTPLHWRLSSRFETLVLLLFLHLCVCLSILHLGIQSHVSHSWINYHRPEGIRGRLWPKYRKTKRLYRSIKWEKLEKSSKNCSVWAQVHDTTQTPRQKLLQIIGRFSLDTIVLKPRIHRQRQALINYRLQPQESP